MLEYAISLAGRKGRAASPCLRPPSRGGNSRRSPEILSTWGPDELAAGTVFGDPAIAEPQAGHAAEHISYVIATDPYRDPHQTAVVDSGVRRSASGLSTPTRRRVLSSRIVI